MAPSNENPDSPPPSTPSRELADLGRRAGLQADEAASEQAPEPPLSLLLIRVGRRWFGLRAESVREVGTKGYVTRVPTAPAYVLGVTLIRGRLVPVLALEGLLGAVGVGDSAQTLPRLVVLHHGETEIALLADETRGIIEHRLENPSTAGRAADRPRYLGAELEWEGTLVCLIDVPILIAEATPREPVAA
jgi:chemotaxis signal transduction protein